MILFFILGIIAFAATIINEPDNFRKKAKQNNESHGNGSNSVNNKVEIRIDTQKEMHQLGKHFNKHGRQMGFASKKEYGNAAFKFAQQNIKNLQSKIFEGYWNGSGMVGKEKQIAIVFDNKTAILDKVTGQLIDFYEGSELRGLINIVKIQ